MEDAHAEKMIDEQKATGQVVLRIWCAHCRESQGLAHRHLKAEDDGELLHMCGSLDGGIFVLEWLAMVCMGVLFVIRQWYFAICFGGIGLFLQGQGDRSSCNKSDGEPAIGLGVIKQSKANELEIK